MRKGLAATTVRDVAEELGVSPGLVHHYFDSMDDLLATAFERARLPRGWRRPVLPCPGQGTRSGALRAFFASYTRAEQDWAFQLWLDAWAEASRRPAVRATSYRLNVAWQQLLVEIIEEGSRRGSSPALTRTARPGGSSHSSTAWPCRPLPTRSPLDRESVVAWSAAYAEQELGYDGRHN